MRRRGFDMLATLGLAVAYVVVARFGLAFDAVAGFATLVWPPTGMSLAAVLLLGYRVWPGIFLGATIANALTGAPLFVALGIGTGNTLEAVVGAYLLGRIPRFGVTLENVTSVVALIAIAVVSTAVSATVGVASLYLGDVVATAQVRETWRAWWVGDMVGALLITPIVLVWFRMPQVRFHQHRGEIVALVVTLVVVSGTTFFSGMSNLPTLASPFHQMDLLFAALIWAALRFGQRGAVTAAFWTSAVAVAGTMRGYGPFAIADLHESLLSLQTFMALVAATVMLLGGIVAERRLAFQEARTARDVATQADRAKSEFLAVMSHELRTPLNAIAGFAELLETGVYGPLNEQQAKAVGRIHHSERQLLSLVDEVLGFARAAKDDVEMKTGNVQVEEAFDAAVPLIQPEVRRKHVLLKRDVSRPMLAVQADPERLQQILASLLSNASKYTEDGGQITLGAEPAGEKVRIWVRDTGIGIPREHIDKVFEPFFQTDHGMTRRSTGVGLGLTIARDLARRMEGDVLLSSEVGSGTTASVLLPAA
jgi:signal transduction histidine kinase